MNQQAFFDRYRYDLRNDKLGGGSFGTVYKAYDHVNNSSRVFFILIPFGALYALLKGTLMVKILYFLSFVGVTFLTFLGAISDAKKGRELIEKVGAD